MAAALRYTIGLVLRPHARLSSPASANTRVRTMYTNGPDFGGGGGLEDAIFSFIALTGSCVFAWLAFDGDGPDGLMRGRGGGGRRGR